jgi:hypothetical protein
MVCCKITKTQVALSFLFIKYLKKLNHTRIAVFWEVIQRRMIVRMDVLGQIIGPFFKGQVPFLGVKYLEDGTDRLPGNVGTELSVYSAPYRSGTQISST